MTTDRAPLRQADDGGAMTKGKAATLAPERKR